MKGFIGIVATLLEYGAETDFQNKDGETPLHIASKNGNNRIILDLINKGADLSFLNTDVCLGFIFKIHFILRLSITNLNHSKFWFKMKYLAVISMIKRNHISIWQFLWGELSLLSY